VALEETKTPRRELADSNFGAQAIGFPLASLLMSITPKEPRKVVHRKEIDYTNLWPIFLAPVIPAAGILLR
jgi:hypothetical protein